MRLKGVVFYENIFNVLKSIALSELIDYFNELNVSKSIGRRLSKSMISRTRLLHLPSCSRENHLSSE